MLKCGTCKCESNSEVLMEPEFTLCLPFYDIKKVQPKIFDVILTFEIRGAYINVLRFFMGSGFLYHDNIKRLTEQQLTYWAYFPQEELAPLIETKPFPPKQNDREDDMPCEGCTVCPRSENYEERMDAIRQQVARHVKAEREIARWKDWVKTNDDKPEELL